MEINNSVETLFRHGCVKFVFLLVLLSVGILWGSATAYAACYPVTSYSDTNPVAGTNVTLNFNFNKPGWEAGKFTFNGNSRWVYEYDKSYTFKVPSTAGTYKAEFQVWGYTNKYVKVGAPCTQDIVVKCSTEQGDACTVANTCGQTASGVKVCDASCGASKPANTCARCNSFSASPTVVTPGGSVALSWNSLGAASATINKSVGSVSVNGSKTVSAPATKGNHVYNITFTNGNNSNTCTTSISVIPVPTCNSFATQPVVIYSGGSTTLNWITREATRVSIGGVGTVSSTGSTTVTATTTLGTSTYTLTATNQVGTATCQANLWVGSCFDNSGQACTVNSCGKVASGTYACDGTCKTSVVCNSPGNYCGKVTKGALCNPKDTTCASCVNTNFCGLTYNNGRKLKNNTCGNYPATTSLPKPASSTCFVKPGDNNPSLPTNTECTKVTGCLRVPSLDINPKSVSAGGATTLTYDLGTNLTSYCRLSSKLCYNDNFCTPHSITELNNHTLKSSSSMDMVLTRDSSFWRKVKVYLTCTNPTTNQSGTMHVDATFR